MSDHYRLYLVVDSFQDVLRVFRGGREEDRRSGHPLHCQVCGDVTTSFRRCPGGFVYQHGQQIHERCFLAAPADHRPPAGLYTGYLQRQGSLL